MPYLQMVLPPFTFYASIQVKVSNELNVARRNEVFSYEDLDFIKGKVSDIVTSFTNIDVSPSSVTKEKSL